MKTQKKGAKKKPASKQMKGALKSEESIFQKYGSKLLAADQIFGGLQAGLREFAGPTRVALLMALSIEDEPLVLDPNGLLSDRVAELKEQYHDLAKWKETEVPEKSPSGKTSEISMNFWKNCFDFPEIIDVLAVSRSVLLQHWFVERHNRIGIDQPIYQWLEAAASNVARDLAHEERENNSGSWSELANYAETAILQTLYEWEQHLIKYDLRMAFPPTTLENILTLSKTLEEGQKPTGKVVFIHESEIEAFTVPQTAFAQHNKLPSHSNSKHLRKLLTLSPPDHMLLCNSSDVLGIIPNFADPPSNAILAEFDAGHGILKVGTNSICEIGEGKVRPFIEKIDLSDVSKLLKQRGIETHWRQRIQKIIREVVTDAKNRHHGCTIYIDLKDEPQQLKGEYFETKVDALSHLGLLKNASSIDGAVHLDKKGYWHGFACLLDGIAVDSENRARGARYNSCLRFSAKKGEENSFLIVASEDGYLNLIEGGLPYGQKPPLLGAKLEDFISLMNWISRS